MTEPRTPLVPDHLDVQTDHGHLTVCYRVDDHWAVLVGLRSFSGEVETVEETIVYVGPPVTETTHHRSGTKRWTRVVEDARLKDLAQFRAEGQIPTPSMRPGDRMTARRRREVNVGGYVEAARRWIIEHPAEAASMGGGLGWAREVRSPRQQLTDRDYAIRARDFVNEGGSYKKLAELYMVNEGTAKHWIEIARDRLLLTRPGRGKRGRSELTDECKGILNGLDQ